MSLPSPATSALVLFSGGQDSTVCLASALTRYRRVETVGFHYGQRHAVEMTQRTRVLEAFGALHFSPGQLGDDHVLDLTSFGAMSATALTREAEIRLEKNGLPSTFVPGRNLLFLTYAAALAYRRGLDVLVGGMCETDYSGYPDCRQETLTALERALVLGLDRPIKVETPLMRLDKAQTWALADALGGSALVEVICEHTHTCYLGHRETRHAWGYGCGECPACLLRRNGFEHWQESRQAN